MTRITVLYFGGLREALGCNREVVEVTSSTLSLAGLYGELCRRHARLPALVASVRLAVNEEFVTGMGAAALQVEHALSDEDVVAFIPPVTGG